MAFFAARQPILDEQKQLVAYELLFRESLNNVFPKIDDDQATSRMIEGLQLDLGLENLANDKLAFINFTHDTLIRGYPMMLPKEQVVIEILETVKPGKRLLNAVIELKQKGYTIALDDYEHQPVWQHFYKYVDLIKIDLSLTSFEEVEAIQKDIASHPHIQLLAEKVENYEEFEQAKAMGFALFQGYFFSKPEVLKTATLDSCQIALTQLLAETSASEQDMGKVNEILQHDVNLSYKLLRYVQSPMFKRQKEVSSIKQAIVQLGQQELHRFVCFLFASQMNQTKPKPLATLSLIRAKFCEQVAGLPGQESQPACAFLVGLLSLLDAMLDAPLEELLDNLPLSEQIKQALLHEQGNLAGYLRLIELLEKADWKRMSRLAKQLHLDPDAVGEAYQDATFWSYKMESFTK